MPAHPALSPTASPNLVRSPGEIHLQLAASQNLLMPTRKKEGWRLRYDLLASRARTARWGKEWPSSETQREVPRKNAYSNPTYFPLAFFKPNWELESK